MLTVHPSTTPQFFLENAGEIQRTGSDPSGLWNGRHGNPDYEYLLRRHNGNADIVAAWLLEGKFGDDNVGEPDERGRPMTKAIAPALPPRRKHTSPADNSMALVRVEQPPAYHEVEDVDLKKALALSMEEQGPPPLEPIPQHEYGPFQDPKAYENRNLDSGTDHALRQALEASINDGKNSLAADVYSERPVEERGRAADGRPAAFRSSDQNSIFAPPVFQSLLAVPQLRARLKGTPPGFVPEGDDSVEPILKGASNKRELTRNMFCHAECTQQAYIDIKPWTGEFSGGDESIHAPANAAMELLNTLVRNLNLSLPSTQSSLFLPILHDPSSATPPLTAPLSPQIEAAQQQDTLYYVIPLTMGVSLPPITTPARSLTDILECHVASDRVGFIYLPEALVFKVERGSDSAGTGKFDFPAKLYFDRWMLDKREFVENVVKAREAEIEESLRAMEDESFRLRRCQGRDTISDLQICIKHFEQTASDGGDPKRKARNERTLEKLKSILKDVEEKIADLTKKTGELRAERSELWNRPDLMNMPYDLKAVLVHDGLLGRAHIFSYVHHGEKWWKVVDADVTEVTEATVLNDSSGVHLGAGAFVAIYTKPFEGEEGQWSRKDRIKSQKLDEEFRETLPPAIRFKFEKSIKPISPGESDEDEYMDAEEQVVVERADGVVDEVQKNTSDVGETRGDNPDVDKGDDMQSIRGDETDKMRDTIRMDGIATSLGRGQKQAQRKSPQLVWIAGSIVSSYFNIPSSLIRQVNMASGQVIGRHEVFEYSYRVGPKEHRKRIKLVVIQRREQRRKSLIAAGRLFEQAPVRLRVNLHRAKYGDPEVVSGSRQIPITLRRKKAPARGPTVTVVPSAAPAPAPPTTITVLPAAPVPPPPEPTRVELVDRPVGSHILIPPVVIIPPSHSPTPSASPSPSPPPPPHPPSRSPSVVSTNRPKVKRSNSLASSFRRFPSLMGIIRRNSKSSAPPTVVSESEIAPSDYDYVDVDPRTSEEDIIVEERESQLGSPISHSARHGPPSVAGSRVSHKHPTAPSSIASGRSRAMSFGSPKNRLIKASPHQVPLPDSLRQSIETGPSSPPMVGAFPVHVRQSAEYEPTRSVTSRHTGDRSVIVPEYAETYLHDSPTAQTRSLHDESVKSRSIHDGASIHTHHTHHTHNHSLPDILDQNRSALDLIMHSPSRHSHVPSVHSRAPSAHSNSSSSNSRAPSARSHAPSAHSHAPSARSYAPSARSHAPSAHSYAPSARTHDASVRDGSMRDAISLREMNGAHSPSLREPSIRDAPSLREQSLRGGGSIREAGLYSPSASMREHLSDGDIENDHMHHYERSPTHSRVGSPMILAGGGSAFDGGYYREGSPSLHAPSVRASTHRGASPSLHAPSRGASPSLHAPSRVGSPLSRSDSPPRSMHAPSVVSHVRSVTSSQYPQSTNGRLPSGFTRAKSPLSTSGSSNSSHRTGMPRGPEIIRVPTTAPSVASTHLTSVSRNRPRSPLSHVDSPRISEAPPIVPPKASSVAGSHRSGRVSEARTTPRSTNSRGVPYPLAAFDICAERRLARTNCDTDNKSVKRRGNRSSPPRAASAASISRASAAGTTRIPTIAGSTISRAPSAAGLSRVSSTTPYRTGLPPSTYAPSAVSTVAPSAARVPLPRSTYAPSVVSQAPTSRAPSAAGIVRAPSAAGVPLPPSAYAPSAVSTVAPSAARVPLPSSAYAPSVVSQAPTSRAPSAAGIVRAPSAARVPLPPSVIGSPSIATISRAPSAAGITRVPSGAGIHRIPPSVIGSQRIPPSIAGSAPSVAPSRHTPPPEPAFSSAPSDIAPESESHGGRALRAQARLEGEKMSMAFEASQKAHNEGNGARAKELSDIGRQHQVRMQELHAEAAAQIFKAEKNAGRPLDEVDLHGLYVKEAISRLSQFIREAPQAGYTTLRVITGKGLHSERGEAQIIPAVQDALRRQGLRHHTNEANAGVIIVELGPRSPVSD
ncbi:hypothetical protein CTheo_4988 [Ceratobasidium theobromae]|uniref:Smr domain-containing protein n=1 Tax=Ceratobasidium theobromae TaxID=1582974 RepID=A0A5N5QIU5_9AGAM|nr:hypothetical protein CTheo_4988 [Ceratobasidium theobromae]